MEQQEDIKMKQEKQQKKRNTLKQDFPEVCTRLSAITYSTELRKNP